MQIGKCYKTLSGQLLFTSKTSEISVGTMQKNSLFVLLDWFEFDKDGFMIFKILFQGKIYYIDSFADEFRETFNEIDTKQF